MVVGLCYYKLFLFAHIEQNCPEVTTQVALIRLISTFFYLAAYPFVSLLYLCYKYTLKHLE